MNALEKLRELVGEIRASNSPAQASAAWSLAGRLLGRMPVDQDELARVIRECDGAGLDAIVTRLEHPEPGPDEGGSQATPVSDAEMTAALRAFRKRLKLSRLSDESKLGGRLLTGGRSSQIDAIIPPREYPPAVWRALVEAGKLKYTGQGFYAPVDS